MKTNFKNSIFTTALILLFAGSIFSQNKKFPICKKYSVHFLNYKNYLVSDFNTYDITNYKINLKLDPNYRFIDGEVKILFEANQTDLQNISLNLNGLQIDSVLQTVVKVNFTRQQDEVNITLAQSIQPGEIDSITIYYRGVPNRGMYFRTGKYGNPLIYTHNEPFDARYWLPCKDDPSDKALLEMRITVPKNFIAASNGSLIETNLNGQNEKQFFWKENYPISTYLIALDVAEYNIAQGIFNWNSKQMPVQYFVYPENFSRGESAVTNTIEMLEFFSDYIGDYPFMLEKYGMAEAPFQEAGAMENQTLTLMGEDIIDNESVIAHELAHQWWGDGVTLLSFENIWLNEGFATYFDALFTEHKYGEEAFKQRMVSSASNASSDDGSINYPIYDPPARYLFGTAVYFKGAWVLHMLRNELGDDIFKSIIRSYFNQYNYKNATTEDFIEICQNTSGKSLFKFFDQWVYHSGMPNIFASWSQENGIVNIYLTQLQTETVFDLDLDLELDGTTNDTIVTVHFNSQNQSFQIAFTNPVTRLIVDPQSKILNMNNSPVHLIPDKTELISLYPNPFNNEMNILYRVNQTQNIKIELWNILGEKIITLLDKKMKIGTYNLPYRASGLASGIYFCVLTSDSKIDNKKIIHLK